MDSRVHAIDLQPGDRCLGLDTTENGVVASVIISDDVPARVQINWEGGSVSHHPEEHELIVVGMDPTRAAQLGRPLHDPE